MKRGFTLIELLVVISIMAGLLALALPNYLSARERARDTKLKSEMNQVKNALRMYYNDYQKYPAVNRFQGDWPFNGCGTLGTTNCNTTTYTCTGFWFAAGGTDGCGTVYMKKHPTSTSTFRYYTKNANDGFALCVEKLENASDPDILESQKCSTGFSAWPSSSSYGPYCVCSD